MTSTPLVDLLRDPNRWKRQTALQLLADRRDASVLPQLKKVLSSETGNLPIEALWAFNRLAPLDDTFSLQLLRHEDPYVRAWTVRLICDAKEVSSRLTEELRDMAIREPHVEVRSQLACSARRLPAAPGLAIVGQLLRRDEDVGDIHLPLLLWWDIEAQSTKSREAVLAMFADESLWQRKIVHEHVLERLMRRYALSGTRVDLLACAQLLRLAPTMEDAQPDEGFRASVRRAIARRLAK